MFKELLQKLGLIPTTLVTTAAAVLISLGITLGISRLAGGSFHPLGFLIALVVPMVFVLTIGFATFRLVFQLYETEQRLHRLSIHDDLTGVFNRRQFIELAEMEYQKAKAGGGSFAIILFDIDSFKAINDTYGHLAGDEVLRVVSQICNQACRLTDTVARFGGDEFVFLVNNTGVDGLRTFMERVCALVNEAPIEFGGLSLSVTISMGAAFHGPDVPDLATLLAQADRALYAAKSSGGDSWMVAGELGK